MTTGKKVLKGCGIAAGAVFVVCLAGLMVLGSLVQMKIIPDSKALRQGEIPKRQLKKLEEMKIIEPGEEVLFFYSGGLLSIEPDGNLFTNERVISYGNLDGEFEYSSAKYPEILSIKRESRGSYLEDTVIEVETEDEWFYLVISIEGGRDKEFEEELIAIWEKIRDSGDLKGSPASRSENETKPAAGKSQGSEK